MRPFEIAADEAGAYVAGLSTPERLVLAQVTGDVVELLGGEEGFVDGEPENDVFDYDIDVEPLPRGPGDPVEPVHIREILDGMDDQDVQAPTDPAVRRLLPDASDDPDIAREFRRFTDDDLRQRKVDRLLLFAEILLDVAPSRDEDELLAFVVLPEEGQAIAGALGDIRQVIGARLGLQTDADTEALYDSVSATWEYDEPEDGGEARPPHAGEAMSGPELFLGSVFLLAGFLQESLTDCLLTSHRRARKKS